MNKRLSRKEVVKRTQRYGALSLCYKLFSIVRSMIQLRVLGITGYSDVLIMAYRIPNMLRKVFGEGALSGALVPVVIELGTQRDRRHAHTLITLSLLGVQAFLGSLLLVIIYAPGGISQFLAPGFSSEKIALMKPLIIILFPFILFVAGSAILAAALQSVHCFWVAAAGPVLYNVVAVTGLLITQFFPSYFTSPGQLLIWIAYFIFAGGCAHFLLHLFYYYYYGFRFSLRDIHEVLPFIRAVYRRFLPSVFGVSILEINVVINVVFGSFLSAGSVTMLHYGNRFMALPLGIFGVAFSTVLLPQFTQYVLTRSHTTFHHHKLTFYLTEAIKYTYWMIMPLTGMLMFFADDIYTVFLGQDRASALVVTTAAVLRTYSCGLFFFSVHRLLLSLYFSLKDSSGLLYASLISLVITLAGNSLASFWWQSPLGIAFSTVCGTLAMVCFMVWRLFKKHQISIDLYRVASFIVPATIHSLFLFIMLLSAEGMSLYLYQSRVPFMGCLPGILYLFYRSRSLFGVRLYFLMP